MNARRSSSKLSSAVGLRGRRLALDELRSFLDAHPVKEDVEAAEFRRFEEALEKKMLEVQRSILAEAMAAADIDAHAIEVEGRTLRRTLRSSQTYMTSCGPIEVERTLYRDRSDPNARALAAMDLKLGIVEGFWTQRAAEQAAWVVTQMTPKKAEELFERVGSMEPSKSSLDRLPKALSERWEMEREANEAVLRDAISIPEEAKSVAVSIDGVLAPVQGGNNRAEVRAQAAKEGRLTKGPAGYREIACATLAFCDEQGDLISAIRFGRGPEFKKLSLKETLRRDLTHVLTQRPDLSVVKIADAGGDNWEYLSSLPDGPEILDFFHATEHLAGALASVYGDGSRKTRHRFEELRERLLMEDDGATSVINSLAYLRRKHPANKTLQRELKYFRKNRKRMRYAESKRAGLMIGSGVVEAACKTLVAQRLKLSGMRWSEKGAQAILTMRGWDQSERFDEAWALVAATYQREVTILNNVIELNSRSHRNQGVSSSE